MEKEAAKNKWMFLASGVVLLALGIFSLVFRVEIELEFRFLVVAAILFKSVVELIFFFTNRTPLQNPGLVLTDGIIGIILTLLMVCSLISNNSIIPSINFAVFLLGFYLMFGGTNRISTSMLIKKPNTDRLTMGIGIGLLFTGFIIIALPAMGVFTVTLMIPVGLIISGVAAISQYLAIK